jgi:hypothetical protein
VLEREVVERQHRSRSSCILSTALGSPPPGFGDEALGRCRGVVAVLALRISASTLGRWFGRRGERVEPVGELVDDSPQPDRLTIGDFRILGGPASSGHPVQWSTRCSIPADTDGLTRTSTTQRRVGERARISPLSGGCMLRDATPRDKVGAFEGGACVRRSFRRGACRPISRLSRSTCDPHDRRRLGLSILQILPTISRPPHDPDRYNATRRRFCPTGHFPPTSRVPRATPHSTEI